jgi:phosphatidylserine/phosphatidylglycerophosphate/cardiolipin synthase-like enzyme
VRQAYYELIEGAHYFVYIENQFFISSTAGSAVQNRVAQALVNRIIRAHKEKGTCAHNATQHDRTRHTPHDTTRHTHGMMVVVVSRVCTQRCSG